MAGTGRNIHRLAIGAGSDAKGGIQGHIRDVISVSKLVKNDGPEQIAEIIGTLAKYGDSRVSET